MPKNPHAPKGLDFGWKVRAWLELNKRNGRGPESETALAALVHETQPRVSRACNTGDPKLGVARKIARAMGMSLDYLSDPDAPFPEQKSGEAWDSLSSILTVEERDYLAEKVRVPGVRELLLPPRESSRGSPLGTPRGSRP